MFTPTRDVGSKALLERYRHARGDSGAKGRASSTPRGSTGPSRRVADARGARGARGARERLADKAGRSSGVSSERSGNRDRAEGRRLTGARGRIAAKGIGDLVARDPVKADRYLDRGRAVATASNIGISIGLGYGFGYPYYGYGGWGTYGYYNPYCTWYRPYWNWYCSWWGYYPFGYYSSYWWRPYYSTYWYYNYSRPAYYASVIYEYESGGGYAEREYVEEQPVEEVVGEGVVQGQENAQLERVLESGDTDTLARASNHYLTLGDSAFRDGRYGDAVHFYAKAVEFAPAEGVLYLVLADALFATGDFHYGAFALRRAFELDPTLLDVEIDKHEFYTDPEDFDRQLATLEGYMTDHPSDSDARLLLAANYLAAARPADAVTLLESPGGSAVREDPAGALIYEAARNR